jgi:hypothetical protein
MMPYQRFEASETTHALALEVYRVTEGWPRLVFIPDLPEVIVSLTACPTVRPSDCSPVRLFTRLD